MKSHREKMSVISFPFLLKTLGSALASCSLLAFSALAAEAATTYGGDSTTILRIRETGTDRNLVPLYEYLHLSGTDTEAAGATSVHVGGWGRIDLGDSTTTKTSNGDLQYGFLRFDGAKNNFKAKAGRQYVTEGVASDIVDGLYVRGDLAMRFTAAAFIGSPVTTEAPGFEGGALIYGGRIAHTVPNLYTVGLSMVKTNSGGNHLREEEGLDLWLHPLPQVDIAGRSVYNSLTGGWNEHDYTATITPFAPLRVSATVNKFDYRHYFHHVTTSALSVDLFKGSLDPREELFSFGGNVGYTAMKNLNVSLDYKHYNYEIQDDTDYFGGSVTYALPGSYTAGVSLHRMDGHGQRLRYNQFRIYASKKMGKADVTLDFIDDYYDASINRIKNTYSLYAAAGYDVSKNFRVGADLEYLRSVDLDHDLRGLFKVVYAFGSERRAK